MTRAALVEGGAPTERWAYALLDVTHNYKNTLNAENEIPVTIHYQVQPAEHIVPFGVGAAAFDESVSLGGEVSPAGLRGRGLGVRAADIL